MGDETTKNHRKEHNIDESQFKENNTAFGLSILVQQPTVKYMFSRSVVDRATLSLTYSQKTKVFDHNSKGAKTTIAVWE